MHKSIIICSMAACLIGCGSGNNRSAEIMEELVMADAEADAGMQVDMSSSAVAPAISRPADRSRPPQEVITEKKIIRTGNMTLRSKDLASSRSRLDSLAVTMGGYIASETFNDQPNQSSYNVSYRIPSGKLDAFLSLVESGGDRLEHKSIRANDVTEQYYDIKIRLENERKLEQRYLELLNRARTVKEILEIEEKLSRVRQEIESKEGRLRYLDNQVNYSTISIFIYQNKEVRYEPEERQGFGQRLIRSLHRGWLGIIEVLLFLFRLWPLWLVLAIAWRLMVLIKKRQRHENR
jgi:hypothetical protein